MVLAERSGNESKYNGTARRTRAPSPQNNSHNNNNTNNGHFTDDSNNSDDSDHGLHCFLSFHIFKYLFYV